MTVPNYVLPSIPGPASLDPSLPTYSSTLVIPAPLCFNISTRKRHRQLLYTIARACRLLDSASATRDRSLIDFHDLTLAKQRIEDSPNPNGGPVCVVIAQRLCGVLEEIKAAEDIIGNGMQVLEESHEKVIACIDELTEIVKDITENADDVKAVCSLVQKYVTTAKVFRELKHRLDAFFDVHDDPFIGADRTWPGIDDGIGEAAAPQERKKSELDGREIHANKKGRGVEKENAAEREKDEAEGDTEDKATGEDNANSENDAIGRDSLEQKQQDEIDVGCTPSIRPEQKDSKDKAENTNVITPMTMKRKLKLPDSARSSHGQARLDGAEVMPPPNSLFPGTQNDKQSPKTQAQEEIVELLIVSQPLPQSQSQAAFSTKPVDSLPQIKKCE